MDLKEQVIELYKKEKLLADRLAEGLRKMILYSEALALRIQDRSDINFKTFNECIDLYNDWKEDRHGDSLSCPDCDALASHGVNDGPCEAHK